jgi:hypothetical protein
MTEDNNVQKIKRWNPCLKDQMEDRKHVGKMTFGRYKEHEHKQLEESGTEECESVGRKWLSKPEPCKGCSAL